MGQQPQTATRTLVVGREIVLSGEISACDRLVVEGTVKANIKDCRDIAISEGGLFTGSASVESAEIRGRFEGELTVNGRLLIRSPGQVSAAVRYGEIEIERGGRLSGHVDVTDALQTPHRIALIRQRPGFSFRDFSEIAGTRRTLGRRSPAAWSAAPAGWPRQLHLSPSSARSCVSRAVLSASAPVASSSCGRRPSNRPKVSPTVSPLG